MIFLYYKQADLPGIAWAWDDNLNYVENYLTVSWNYFKLVFWTFLSQGSLKLMVKTSTAHKNYDEEKTLWKECMSFLVNSLALTLLIYLFLL